jgi:uncharacterized membrane protein YqjE
MASLLAPLVPAVLRHLEAYAEVVGEDAREAAGAVARRLLALLIAAAASFIALLMFCVWLLALAWDSPWRTWTAAGLAVAFAVGAAALAFPVLRRRTNPEDMLFPRVRQELKRDRVLIDRALNGGNHAAK